MEKNYLEQQAQIFDTAEVEIGFPGEEELVSITSGYLLSEEDRNRITCACENCKTTKNAKKTVVKHEVVKTKYVDFAKKMRKRTSDYINETSRETKSQYENALNKVEEGLQKLKALGDDSKKSTRKEILKIARENVKAYETVENLAEKVAAYQQSINMLSTDSIREDVKQIMADERVESISQGGKGYDSYLDIVIKQMIVSNTAIGPLKIRLPVHGIPRVYKTDDSNLSKNGYWHPHVQTSGGVCFGDAGTAAQVVFNERGLHFRFDFLATLLNGYNPASPYEKISNWAPMFCMNCEEPLKGSNIHNCSCGSVVCKKCAEDTKTSCCKKSVCPVCSSKCKNCQSIVCKDSIISKETGKEYGLSGCDECKKEGCVLCIQTCRSCNSTRHLCQDCSYYCSKCGRAECKECAKVKPSKTDDKLLIYTCPKGHRNKIKKLDEAEKIAPMKRAKKKARPAIRIKSVRPTE